MPHVSAPLVLPSPSAIKNLDLSTNSPLARSVKSREHEALAFMRVHTRSDGTGEVLDPGADGFEFVGGVACFFIWLLMLGLIRNATRDGKRGFMLVVNGRCSFVEWRGHSDSPA